jgi:hypothetical protein
MPKTRVPPRHSSCAPISVPTRTQDSTRGNASDPLLAKGAHLHRVDREAPGRVTSKALLSREREIGCLLDFRLTPADTSGESDHPHTTTGATALPRTEESRRARRHGCIAREMRKPNRATRTAAGALLLFCGLRLLVRHGCDSRADRIVVTAGEPPNCPLRTTTAADTRLSARGAALPQPTTCER